MSIPSITPQAFVDKWRYATLKERSAYQEHFIDLCRLIGHPTPAEVDPTGENFAFEYGAVATREVLEAHDRIDYLPEEVSHELPVIDFWI